MLRNFRYSARSFTRRPGLALALLFTIALGIASIVSVRGFVDGLTKPLFPLGSRDRLVSVFGRRSEEHTSELQSHSDLVCRLLLEKKKDNRCASPADTGFEDRRRL